MSCLMDDCVKYGLIGAVRVYIDDRWVLSHHWIEADTITILSPPALVGLPEDKLMTDAHRIFKF